MITWIRIALLGLICRLTFHTPTYWGKERWCSSCGKLRSGR